MGRHPVIERLNEAGPVLSRSDGETFHLILGDRPISFPAEKSSGRTEMKTAGFWYITERNGANNAFTQTVVVILRKAPRGGAPLLRHLEMVADELSEKLAKPEPLETLYEYEGNRLHRVW
jgi:DNA-binding CsgD family transcriptional regulator